MQRGNEKRRLSLGAGALAALALSGSGMAEWKSQAAHHGKMGRAQVIARSESVCREFMPEPAMIRVEAQHGMMAKADGIGVRYWMVDCLDTGGVERAHMIWDSQSGNLQTVSRQTPTSSRTLVHPINRRQAVMLAGQSLRNLPIATHGEQWRLKEVEFSRTTWHVSCRTRSHRAHVVIDAATGDLLSVFGGRVSAVGRS